MISTRYNSPNPMYHIRSCPRVLTTVLLLLLTSAAWCADWAGPTAQFAAQIAAITGPGAASLTVKNASSLNDEQVRTFRSLLNVQLKTQGVTLTTRSSAASEIRATLSENAGGYLWVAEIKQGTQVNVTMLSVPRTTTPAAHSGEMPLTLRTTPLFERGSRLLDFVLQQGPSGRQAWLVEDRGQQTRLVELQEDAGGWNETASLEVPHGRPWPRDLRASISVNSFGTVIARLPGYSCTVDNVSPPVAQCKTSDDPWNIAPWNIGPGNLVSEEYAFYNANRNFFTGLLSPPLGSASDVGPFYSATPVPHGQSWVWFFSGVDGKLRSSDGVNLLTINPHTLDASLGSEIATLASGCGSGSQLLASASGEQPQHDSIRAFGLEDRDLVPASSALELAGEVRTLHADPDAHAVLAVINKPATGKYEAISITAICGR